MTGSILRLGSEQWQVRWIEDGPSLGCEVEVERYVRGRWTRIQTLRTKTPVDFARLSFINPRDGWLMVTSGPGYPSDTSVYRTENGGRSWSQQLSATKWRSAAWGQKGFFGDQIAFVDAQDGWIFASQLPGAGSAPKELMRSRDGGAHWSMVADSQALSGYIGTDQPTQMAFTTPEIGWIAASTDATSPGATAYLYRTGDGGRTWAPVALPVPSTGPKQWIAYRAQQLTFERPSDGLLVYRFIPAGGFGRTYCYTTHDGGRGWTVAICRN